MAERKVCKECGCVFSTAGYENPNATSHEHWEGCIAALQAELAAERERADQAEQALKNLSRTLVEVFGGSGVAQKQERAMLKALVDEGPFADSEHGVWACCGASYYTYRRGRLGKPTKPEHADGCPYQKAVDYLAHT